MGASDNRAGRTIRRTIRSVQDDTQSFGRCPDYSFGAAQRVGAAVSQLSFHRGALGEVVTIVDGLPVTSLPRTVEEIAHSLDLDQFSEVIRDALSSPQITAQDLASRLAERAETFGFTFTMDLIEYAMRHAGLPAAAANVFSSGILAERRAKQVLPTIRSTA